MTNQLQRAFFNDQSDTRDFQKALARMQAPSIGFEQYARAIGITLALMLGAYVLWAQDFGNTGFAVFLAATAVIFVWYLSHSANRSGMTVSYVGVLLLSLGLLLGCLRLVWQPNPLICVAAILHLFAIVLVMQGPQKGPLRLIFFAFQSAMNGVQRWVRLPWERIANGMSESRLAWLSWGVPLVVGLVFVIPLLQSHPDVASRVFRKLTALMGSMLNWATQINVVATLLVSVVGIWSLGLLLPSLSVGSSEPAVGAMVASERACSQIAYVTSRNTLIVVSCIFVWFLVVEIQATWFRKFPDGFIYSTYAHQGAAWLTVALGMSTIAISVLFQPEIHQHPRVATLRRLAGFWSFCNALLVIAVFYRLIIYVNFNGMTRMRVIGFVGVACVVAGFVIVNFRIVHQKPMAWIVHKQCWAFLWSIYLLALLPMDSISHGWNLSRIRAGHLAPAVQIAVHEISDEGLVCLVPLVHSEHPEIREGVAALLAERYLQETEVATEFNTSESNVLETRPVRAWTQFQGSRSLLEKRLQGIEPQLRPFLLSTSKRQQAIARFRVWTNRWY